ncbi:MAG: hypothetical protein KC457_29255, partial [Myxococcales bacterium]|nr:hypothetical protein [Myxococcales bacterium]
EVPAPDLRAVVFAEGIPSLDFQACSLEVFASSTAAILEVGPHSVLSRIVFRSCTLKRPAAAASLVRVLRVNPAAVANIKLAFEHSILTPGPIALLVTPDRETRLGPYPALVDWVETTTT